MVRGAPAILLQSPEVRRVSSRSPQPVLGFSTRAIHVGYDPSEAKGALTPPVYLTSTYAFELVEQAEELFSGQREGYIYGRTRNPTQTILEQRIASLEGAEAALAVASGMGAISATLWTLVGSGDHVVIDEVLYGNSFALFTKGLTRFGVKVTIADFTQPRTVLEAVTPDTRLVFFETPANPNLRVIDIAAVAAIAARSTHSPSSTTPSRPRRCSARSSMAPTSSSIPPPSIWARHHRRSGDRLRDAGEPDPPAWPALSDRRDPVSLVGVSDPARLEDPGLAHGPALALGARGRRAAFVTARLPPCVIPAFQISRRPRS